MRLIDYKVECAWIGLPVVEGFAPSNTTVVVHNNELLFQTRYVSYTKHLASEVFNPYGFDMCQNYLFDNPFYESRNFRWGNGKFNEIVYPTGEEVRFRGLEDARMVVWNGELYTYGVRCDKANGKTRIVIYTPDGREVVAQSPFDCDVEKNWMAVPDRPMTFVYSFKDYRVVVVKVEDDGSCRVVDNNNGNDTSEWLKNYWIHFNDIRGGSPLVKIDDGYLAVVHRQEWINTGLGIGNGYWYRHAIVRFDNNLNVVDITRWFILSHPLCEFCSGMAVYGDKVYLTYSVLDCIPMIMEFTLDGVMGLFGVEDDREEVDINYWEVVMVNLFNNGHVRSAGVLANWLLTLGFENPLYIDLYRPALGVEEYMKIKYRR